MVAAVTAAAVELTPFLGGGPMTIPCYVSGKGMYATDRTRQFKVSVIEKLEATGMGYDTRYRYYQQQFPTMAASALAQMICDPIEYYDRDWAAYQAAHGAGCKADEVLTAFMLERDARFRQEAQVAIYCYDEAGFGSGLNTMRFLQAEKPILGFYHAEIKQQGVNLNNILQLAIEFPGLVTLVCYQSRDAIGSTLLTWLQQTAASRRTR
jgi:hypothetical protein